MAEALEAVNQHRAVLLLEDRSAHLDHQVGSDPEEVLIEGRVVELAEGEIVGDGCSPLSKSGSWERPLL